MALGLPLALLTAAPRPARAQVPDSTTEWQPRRITIPNPFGRPDLPPEERRKLARQKMTLGLELERAHEPAGAITAYRTAVALDSLIPEANYRMGMLFLTVNQLRPAAQCFVQEVIHHPGHVRAGRQLGITFARLGRSRLAVLQLESLTRRNPRDAETWAALGFAYQSAGRSGAADTALRRAIAFRPATSAWHRDLGVVLAAENREDEARREYRRAIRLDPRDATAWVDLGNLERRGRHFDAAIDAYRAAEKRDTLSVLAIDGQAQTLRDLHRDMDAAAVYRRWLARKPDDHNARLDLVRLFDDLGRDDAALEVAREGVRAEPGSPDAHLVLGMALQSAGDWRGGVAEMREAERDFKAADDRARVRALIAAMRSQAPDSLRAFFAADSVAHPLTAAAPAPKKRPMP
ncbi:MAG TPA: tetratricopeptide repeat protein [Candidatus Udaeobacter sp.]|nr:tetratricopeptide repeat protein [Candidatus Udaeobacter sp.]